MEKPIAISVIAPVALTGILVLAILVISSTNEAFAQKKPCDLTLNVSPDTIGVEDKKLTGKLTCGGWGVGGATITFRQQTGTQITGISDAVTGQDGAYSTTGIIGYGSCPEPHCFALSHVEAHYAGDSEHMSANSEIFTLRNEGYGGP